jgi:hypothetical protein
VPDKAGRGARRGPDGVPDGLDGVADRRIIYFKKEKRHVLYTCHVNHRQHPTCPTPGGCKKNLR